MRGVSTAAVNQASYPTIAGDLGWGLSRNQLARSLGHIGSFTSQCTSCR